MARVVSLEEGRQDMEMNANVFCCRVFDFRVGCLWYRG